MTQWLAHNRKIFVILLFIFHILIEVCVCMYRNEYIVHHTYRLA